MDVIGEAAYKIRADTSGFQKEAEGGLLPAMKKIGGVLAAAFAAKKIFDFGKDAVLEAAKTEKAVEQVRASFGRFSKGLIDINKNMAQFGVSNALASEFSATIGQLGDNIGLTDIKQAEMTANLEKLGANMAAIRGIDPSEVFDVLTTSLSGSTRGLKQFGIVIGTTQIQQEAMRLGLIKHIDTALTPAQRAQAVYSLEMEHFGKVQQEASKHSDDLTNVTQRLGAQFDNLKETIGEALLPFIERIAIVIETRVIPFIQEWTDKITNFLTPAIEAATGFIEDHADAILDVSKAFITASGAAITLGSAFEAISLGAELLASPIALVLAIGTAAVLAYQKVQVFHDVVNSAFDSISTALGPLASAIRDAFDTINQAFEAAGRHRKFSVQVKIIWEGVKQAASELWDAFLLAWNDQTQLAPPIMVRGKNIQFEKNIKIEGLRTQLKDAVKDGVRSAFTDVDIDFGEIGSILGHAWIDMMRVFKNLVKLTLTSFWEDFLPALQQGERTLFAKIPGALADFGLFLEHSFSDAVRGIDFGDAASGIFDTIGEFFSTALADINFAKTIESLPSKIVEAIVGVLAGIDFSGIASDLWDRFTSSIGDFFGGGGGGGGGGAAGGGSGGFLAIDLSSLLNFDFGGLAAKINQGLGGLPGQVAGIMSRVVGNVVSTLSGLVGQAGGIMANVASAVVANATSLPGRIGSIFINMVTSALNTLRGMIGSAASAAANIVSRIVDAFTGIAGKIGGKLTTITGTIHNALSSAASAAFNYAVGLGQRIIEGVLSGLGGLASRVASKIGSEIGSGVSSAWGLVKGSPAGPGERAIREHITGPMAKALQTDIGLMGSGIASALGTSLGAGIGSAAAATPGSSSTIGGTGITTAKPVTVVHVHFDDPTLKGLINVQIDDSDRALADAIAAGTR